MTVDVTSIVLADPNDILIVSLQIWRFQLLPFIISKMYPLEVEVHSIFFVRACMVVRGRKERGEFLFMAGQGDGCPGCHVRRMLESFNRLSGMRCITTGWLFAGKNSAATTAAADG
jgi:hypothetical protein